MSSEGAAERIAFGPRFSIPILIGPALNPINTTMIAVALVPIEKAVHVPASTAIWLVAGLYLAGAVSQPTMGKLADHFGPKAVYLSGMAVVIVASFLPLLLDSFVGALLSRVLLGIGTSAAYPAAMTFLTQQSARIGRDTPQTLLSALSMSSLVTAAIGPVLGGLLIDAFGWQSIFLVNAPLAGITLVLAWLWLPGDRTRPGKRDSGDVLQAIDPVGILLFAVTIGAALFFLLDLSPALVWLIPVAVVACVAFVLWERHHPRPFIDVTMLAANGALSRTYLRLFLVFTAIYLVLYGVSQWAQAVGGISSGTAGLLQLPAAALAFLSSLVVARTAAVRLPLTVAAVAPLAGGLFLLTLVAHSPIWAIVLALAFFGLPQGLASISNQAALYRQVPPGQMGASAGLSRTAVQVGAIVASSVIGIVFGQKPSDTGLHAIGWVVAGLSLVALLLTVFDRALRRPATKAPGAESDSRSDRSPERKSPRQPVAGGRAGPNSGTERAEGSGSNTAPQPLF